jgi:hypothetical protein
MKELNFILRAEEYWVTNFPQSHIDNEYFRSVMEQFDAEIRRVEKFGGVLIRFSLIIEKEKSQEVIDWIKNYVKLVKT